MPEYKQYNLPEIMSEQQLATQQQIDNTLFNVGITQREMKSPNYQEGERGWRITETGNAEFNDGTFRGQLIAGSIDIPNTTSVNSFHVDGLGNTWWGSPLFATAELSISSTGLMVFSSSYTLTGLGDLVLETTQDFEINAGGDIDINSGTGDSIFLESGAGGFVSITSDPSTNSNGGGVTIAAGSCQSGNGDGGSILFKTGAKSGSGVNGFYLFNNPVTSIRGILSFDLITTADKTYTFPNVTSTLAVTTGHARATAQTAANTNILTVTVGAADATLQLLANVLVTTATTHSISVTVDYTDESNVARVVTIPFVQLAGTIITAITNVTGAGPYEGVATTIRAKAATNIVFKTAGTFTTIAYNVDCSVVQVATT